MKSLGSNRIVQLLALLVGVVAVGITAIVWINQSRAIYIGVVSSDKGPYADERQQFEDGAKIMAQELNQNENCAIFTPWNSQCGISGRVVKILPIQSEADVNKVSAVIGDFQGDSQLTDSAYYQEKSIPAILASSTDEIAGDNPYVFRIVPDNRQVGTFLANYARIDLAAQTASIIYDSADPNSAALRDGFRAPFISLVNEEIGLRSRGRIIKEWDLSNPGISADIILINILSPGRSENPGLIFLAVGANQAAPLLVEMHRKGVRNVIVGNTDLSGESFNAQFAAYPEDASQPGYFTDGLYASAPIIFDGANQSAQNFRNKFRDQNESSEPSWAAAVAYDAVHVVSAAVVRGSETGAGASLTDNIEENRTLIKDGLNALNGINYSDNGITGKTFFQFQDSGKPISMGIFTRGKFITAPVQYYPVEDVRIVPDFNTKLGEGRIITRGGHYFYKTDIIYSGINYNEISNIDENEPSYFVDFYLWFRYRSYDPNTDPITPEKIQFINALDLPDIVEVENRSRSLGINEANAASGAPVYKLFRVKGKFTSAFDFKSYPFDQQEIEIRFRHNGLQRENLIFVVDKVDASNEARDQSNVLNAGGDWNAGANEFFQDSAVIRSALGNPELFQIKNPDIEYSTFNARIPIWRNLLSFMLRNLLPVLFSIMLAYLSFFLPRQEFETRETVLSGTILSIAFFHLSVSSFLGGIGYTTALDNIFYIFYAIILAGLGTTLFEWLKEGENEKLEKELEEIKAASSKASASAKQKVKELEEKIEKNTQYGLQLFQLGRVAYPLILLGIAIGFGYAYRGTIFHKNGAAVGASSAQIAAPTAASEAVVLRLGSWRADDQEAVSKILAEFKKETNIEVRFEPTVNADYERILRLQLEKDIAPDLIYLSPNGGRVLDPESLYKLGYLMPLNDIVPELSQSFAAADLQTWETDDQIVYGAPIYAVSHGVYYNTEIFRKLDLSPPKTWEELLQVAQKLKELDYIPIANGTYEKTDPQRIGDYYFLSLAPTYIGGSEGRKKFEDGSLCFNDPSVVKIFHAIQGLAPYMADDLKTLNYTDSIQRFYDGDAAMYFSGSFDIDKFEKSANVQWSVFPIPAPDGYTPYVTFHVDTAIAINKNSPHAEQAIQFVKWLTQRKFGELVGEYLPGFYPLNKDLKGDVGVVQNEHSKTFLSFNNNPRAKLDVRWDIPIKKVPDGRTLIQQGIFGVINGTLDPQQAADNLQNGLAQWYPPAQMCQPIPTPMPTPTLIPTSTPIYTDTPLPTFDLNLIPTPTP